MRPMRMVQHKEKMMRMEMMSLLVITGWVIRLMMRRRKRLGELSLKAQSMWWEMIEHPCIMFVVLL